MDDDAIIDLFWQRAEDALTAVEGKFGAYCRKIADNILDNREDTEECVNETWLKAWNAIPPAKPTALKAFLGKICRNLALDRYAAAHAKRRGSGAVAIALEELADIPVPEHTDGGEITRSINDFLRAEPNEHADIFVQRYWYFCGIGQIASAYGSSESKITSLLFRMRGRLKQKLESEGLL